jgi:hypothetical protein
MKNNTTIRSNILGVLREELTGLGVIVSDDVWTDLVIASAGELEHSKAHVIE